MKVSIVMGSISDKNIGEKVVKTLKEFGVDYEVKVISAHRSLDLALDYCRDIDKIAKDQSFINSSLFSSKNESILCENASGRRRGVSRR